MPSGGRLRLGTRWQRATRRATAFVRDSGAGIDSETMKHIFEPFYTTKPAGKGTGLGLFVSYGIVSRHGGTLGCTSRPATAERPGETTFTVALPLHRED
jgi:signal transduction histidine kinase